MPGLVLGLLAFLWAATSGEVEQPGPFYPDYADQLQSVLPLSIQRTFESKRALTLLSRLAPIRNVFRAAGGGKDSDRHFDARAFRPRWHSDIMQRAPGPLRWG